MVAPPPPTSLLQLASWHLQSNDGLVDTTTRFQRAKYSILSTRRLDSMGRRLLHSREQEGFHPSTTSVHNFYRGTETPSQGRKGRKRASTHKLPVWVIDSTCCTAALLLCCHAGMLHRRCETNQRGNSQVHSVRVLACNIAVI